MDQLLALDVDTGTEARALADTLRGIVGGCKVGSRPRPLVIAATMLTSLNEGMLIEVGVVHDMAGQVGRLVSLRAAETL